MSQLRDIFTLRVLNKASVVAGLGQPLALLGVLVGALGYNGLNNFFKLLTTEVVSWVIEKVSYFALLTQLQHVKFYF